MPQIRSIVLLFTDIKNASKPAKTKHYISIQSEIMSTQVFDMRLLAWIWDDLTCIDFCRAHTNSYASVEAGFSPFGQPSQVRTQALVFANLRRLAPTCINLRVRLARALYIP